MQLKRRKNEASYCNRRYLRVKYYMESVCLYEEGRQDEKNNS